MSKRLSGKLRDYALPSKEMDIVALPRTKFTDEELKKAFGGPPKSKLARIVESMESARKKE